MQEYEKTVRNILDFPGLDTISVEISSHLAKPACTISEECHPA